MRPPISFLCLAVLLGLSTAVPAAGAEAKKAVPEQLRWNEDWGPLVPHKKFPSDCSLCHVPKRWDVLRGDFRYDHKKETGFALEGAHAGASCLRCHNDRGPVAAYKARGCAGCHVDPHKSAMGMDCVRCHGQQSWALQGAQGERIADHARTRFPLSGMHATLSCDQCHTRAAAGDFRGAPRDCFQCHRMDFAAAPKHASAGFPHDCRSCHKSATFAGAVFDHVAFGAGANCVSCHLPKYQSAPNHVAQNFSQTCAQCHNTSSWAGARFVHPAGATNCVSCHLAKYQSAPNHVAQNFPQTCAQCHSTSAWAGASFVHAPGSTNCVSCHLANYQSAPNHVAQSYPQTCASCHTQATWLGAVFNHAAAGASSNCATCHHPTFVAAASPVNHAAQGIIESACSQCHSNASAVWQPASFVHSPSSCYDSGSFRSHKNATCAQCHAGGYPTATCTACHQNRATCD